MNPVLFPTPSNIRSVIVEDVCAFSVSSLLTKTVLNGINVDEESKILILSSELNPTTPLTTSGWNSLLNRNVTEYQNLQREDLNNDTEFSLLENFYKRLEIFSNKYPTDKVVLITNLTSLLLTHSPSRVSRLLVAIDNIPNLRLAFYGIHGDCHEESIRNGLRKLCDAVLVITEPNYDGKGSAKCQLTTFKTKGKNSRLVSYYHISSSLEFVRVQKATTINTEKENEDETLETTFNLGLKVSERKAKTQVQLPFWRPEQKSGHTQQTRMQSGRGVGGGEIMYIADETDDCDEEDPDDEINI